MLGHMNSFDPTAKKNMITVEEAEIGNYNVRHGRTKHPYIYIYMDMCAASYSGFVYCNKFNS